MIISEASGLRQQNNLRAAAERLSSNVARLSTGNKIVTGADDPSGKLLANKFATQISGYHKVAEGVQLAMTFLKVRMDAMNTANGILQRIRDLSVKAANGALYTSEQTTAMQNEAGKLVETLNRINSFTTFNDKNVFDRSYETVPGGVFGPLFHAGQTFISIDLASAAASNGGTAVLYGAWYDGSMAFPDFNLVSPDGTEAFGYLYATHGGGSGVEAYVGGAGNQTITNAGPMDTATQITYSGWSGYAGSGGWDEESFSVTNPQAGAWTLIIDNEQPVEKKFGIFVNEPAKDPNQVPKVIVGPNNTEDSFIDMGFFEINSLALGVGVSFASAAAAAASIGNIDNAIAKLSQRFAETGSQYNVLNGILNTNESNIAGFEKMKSGITDANAAEELTAYTKNLIVSQGATSILSQDLDRMRATAMQLLAPVL